MTFEEWQEIKQLAPRDVGYTRVLLQNEEWLECTISVILRGGVPVAELTNLKSSGLRKTPIYVALASIVAVQ